jgi:hypothetical protein
MHIVYDLELFMAIKTDIYRHKRDKYYLAA